MADSKVVPLPRSDEEAAVTEEDAGGWGKSKNKYGPPKEGEGEGEGEGKVKEQKPSLVAKVYATLDKTVEKDKSLDGAREAHVPNGYLIPIWLIAKSVFIAVLVGLTTLSFNTDQAKKYLSPNYAFGSSSTYRTCKLIPTTFSGNYLLDSNGFWQGTKDFMLGKAKYVVTFNDFSHDYTEYAAFMTSMKNAIAGVAANAVKQTVAQNLLTWMSYAWVYTDGSVQHVMRFVGDPAVVLNRVYKQAAVMSHDTPCGAEPDIDINTQGEVTVSYPINAFGQVYNPPNSKGCCISGTVYKQIGNPLPKATQVSTTWGVIATSTYSKPGSGGGNPTTVTANLKLTADSSYPSTATSKLIKLVVTLDGAPSTVTVNDYGTIITTTLAPAALSKNYVLCMGEAYAGSNVTKNACSAVTSIVLVSGNVATFNTSAPLTFKKASAKPYLIDTSKITMEDLAFIGYQPHGTRVVSNVVFPDLSEAATQFAANAKYYPGNLEGSSGGDLTEHW